ncbi:MAG: phosphatidate cytidylyltransferase [Parabacteroides distasonis]|nr:phosphatidate cytidylyltransferase [Parabacteroides distasonis]
MKNLIIRVLTGAIFGIVLISSICLHPLSFLILFSLITALTLWEFCGLVKQYENTRLQQIMNTIGGVYLFVATFTYANELVDGKIFLPYLLFLILTMIAELYYKAPNPINNWAYTLFAQLYIAGCFSILNFIGAEPNTPGMMSYSPLMVMAIFIFVWLSDTGAYFVGSMIGKRKLFERISPKKSWEGFFGGLFFALASSQALAWYAPEIGRLTWLGLALTVVLFGTWGDLIESLLKRTIGVKDSGNLLPGHGGMLDRFDSVILAAPASYIYIELFIRN